MNFKAVFQAVACSFQTRPLATPPTLAGIMAVKNFDQSEWPKQRLELQSHVFHYMHYTQCTYGFQVAPTRPVGDHRSQDIDRTPVTHTVKEPLC